MCPTEIALFVSCNICTLALMQRSSNLSYENLRTNLQTEWLTISAQKLLVTAILTAH